jgi:hypothetical protein
MALEATQAHSSATNIKKVSIASDSGTAATAATYSVTEAKDFK